MTDGTRGAKHERSELRMSYAVLDDQIRNLGSAIVLDLQRWTMR